MAPVSASWERCSLTDLSHLRKDISYLTVSDIHFFNDLNESAYIADSMMEYMGQYSSSSRFRDLDIIFIDGDITDTYRDSKHPDILTVSNWMRLMMEFCKRNSIKLRVLEGTPGHDYRQAANFSPMAEAFGEELDYKYFDKLDFERMEDLNLTILYIPDEWAGSASVCKEQIIDMMRDNHIEKFDIAHMHGMFDFQIPEVGEHPLKHDSEWFHEIVRSYINIGHDHTFKTQGRILVQGSFDRIAHGEEGRKGGIVCHLRRDGESVFEFIENKRARTFKTCRVRVRDLDAGIAQVRKVLDALPDNSHIRISSAKDNPIFTVMDEFKRAHPRMKFKKHEDKYQENEEKRDALRETIGLSSSYVAISLDKENIVEQIFKNMTSELSDADSSLLRSELASIV